MHRSKVTHFTAMRDNSYVPFILVNLLNLCQHSSSTYIWSIHLSWYDIPEFVFPAMVSLIEGCC